MNYKKMPVNIKIVSDENNLASSTSSGGIKIKVVKDEATKIEMVARRALNGDIMIFEHDLIDVVISPSNKKVVAFPKDTIERETYAVQDRFFNFLVKKGIVDPAKIQGGSVFSSIEAEIYESKMCRN